MKNVVDFSSECAEDDLQETFIKYLDSYIEGYNMDVHVRDDEGSCLEWCRSVTECRTVDYNLNSVCFLQDKTALDVPVRYWITEDRALNHYQKMCA